MTDDVRKLLAGYATGTLSDAERRTLFEAALTDEDLFAAISDEEPLRELLSEPASRAELLARIEPAPVAFRERFAAWLRRPVIAGGLAVAALAVAVVAIIPMTPPSRQVIVAEMRAPAAAVTPPLPAANEIKTQRRPARQPNAPAAAPIAPAAAPAAAPAPRLELRDMLVMSKAADAATSAPRFSVLRRSENGEYVKVDAAHTIFAPGDLVRVRVEPGEAGVANIAAPAQPPTVGAVAQSTPFETGDIRVGNEDMRLSISFTTGAPVVNTLARSQFAAEPPAGSTEIVLRVKKP
jgi:hypothetical protein